MFFFARIKKKIWLIKTQLTLWCFPYTSCSRISIRWVRVSYSNSANILRQVFIISHIYQTWFLDFLKVISYICCELLDIMKNNLYYNTLVFFFAKTPTPSTLIKKPININTSTIYNNKITTTIYISENLNKNTICVYNIKIYVQTTNTPILTPTKNSPYITHIYTDIFIHTTCITKIKTRRNTP